MKGRITAIIILVLAIAGAAQSARLTWDHQLARTQPLEEGVCGRGSGCEISRFSPYSQIPLPGTQPLPIAILGLGYYLAALALGGRRLLRRKDESARRLQLLLAGAAVVYSVALGVYSIAKQGKLCEQCSILYGINLALLIAACVDIERWRGMLRGLLRAPWTRAGALAAAAFTMTVAGAFAWYVGPVAAVAKKNADRSLTDAQAIASKRVVEIDAADRPSHGRADAPIHIVEFADYECGHCFTLFTRLDEVVKQRPEDLRVTVMAYPRDNRCNPHSSRATGRSCESAIAAECAHRQGKWHAMAGWLFEKGRTADDAALAAHAGELGMDSEAFAACLASDDAKRAIAEDLTKAVKAGVEATPTFFVNGHEVVGARSIRDINVMIDTLLGRVGEG